MKSCVSSVASNSTSPSSFLRKERVSVKKEWCVIDKIKPWPTNWLEVQATAISKDRRYEDRFGAYSKTIKHSLQSY